MSVAIALELVQGEAYLVTGTHRDAAGVVVPIGGWLIRLYGQRRYGDPDPPAIEAEATVVGSGTGGLYQFMFTSLQTRAIPAFGYVCEVWRVNAGVETQMAHGTLLVKKGIKPV